MLGGLWGCGLLVPFPVELECKHVMWSAAHFQKRGQGWQYLSPSVLTTPDQQGLGHAAISNHVLHGRRERGERCVEGGRVGRGVWREGEWGEMCGGRENGER